MIIKELIGSMLPSIWPLIFFVCIIAITLRIAYLLHNNNRIVFHKEFLHLIFIVYILCLYYILTNNDSASSGINFIPFKEMFRYEFGSYQFYKNIIGNIMMFIPFGYFASRYLNNRKCSIILITTAIICTAIEGMQYYLGRVFDIDDIILNITGSFIGFLIYVALSAIVDRLPKFMKSDTFINAFIILLIILVVFFSFDINIFNYM